MEPRTKRNLAIWAIALLVILNISSLATIWYHRYQFKNERRGELKERRFDSRRGHEGQSRHRMPPFMVRNLALSEEQEANLDSIWGYFNQRRRLLEDSMNSTRRTMFTTMTADELDTNKYESLSQQQVALMIELNLAMLEMNRAIRDNLSEDQRRLFSERMQELQSRRRPQERRQRTRK